MNEIIVLIADTHCENEFIETILSIEQKEGNNVKCILHAGDFGIYDKGSLGRLSKREVQLIQKHRTPIQKSFPYINNDIVFSKELYWIPGNHEDFRLVELFKRNFNEIKNFTLLKPNKILELELDKLKLKILALGKIWPNEINDRKRLPSLKYITDYEYNQAIDESKKHKKIDLLLLHEPPYIKDITNKTRPFGSKRLKDLISIINPKIVISGHMHFEFTCNILNTNLIGLGYGSKGAYCTMDNNLNCIFKTIEDNKIVIKEDILHINIK